jgi:beta-lactamase superfamily II metal-dependent hydrolase
MRLHFLNVKNGDCNILEHSSGNITVVDISNGQKCESTSLATEAAILGNFNQKSNSENPICYLADLGKDKITRFILTHPDMDHMDGLDTLFRTFKFSEFLNVKNNKIILSFSEFNQYNEKDWDTYKKLKGNFREKNYYSGDTIENESLTILSPTKEIVKEAIKKQDFNISSYVLLWKIGKYKIILAGDSGDIAWDHIIENHNTLVSDIDILLAPHHGRDSNRDYSFLDTLKPKYTFIGNAKSKHLEYDKYKKYGQTITNN